MTRISCSVLFFVTGLTSVVATEYNPLMDTLLDQFLELNNQRSAEVRGLGTDQQRWVDRQASTRQHLEQLFAPVPSKRPPPPLYNVTRTIVHPTGFRFQTILFQSRPGLWVTGSLWTPAEALTKPDIPSGSGVLLLSGHTHDAWRCNGRSIGDCTGPLDNCTGPDHNKGGGGVPNPHTSFPANPGGYQLVAWNLVHKGFTVLAIDPIGQGERLEYLGTGIDGGSPWGTFEHEYLARQLFLNGRSAASFWLHDEQAAVDLLESLPWVNATRLGSCGCSGGGTQSAYIGAVDSRIKAASIACYMSTLQVDYEYVYGGEYDGEQTWPRAAVLSLDKPDLVEIRAPNPTQILLTTEDNCFPFAGGKAAATEAEAAFAAYGIPDNLDVHQAVYHHGWVNPNREAMYAFFQTHLQGNPTADATEWWPQGFGNLSALFTPDQTQVTSTGQVRTAPECAPNLIYHNFTASITATNLAALEERRAGSLADLATHVTSVAGAVSGYRAPAAVDNGQNVRDRQHSRLGGSVTLDGEGKCTIGVQWASPPNSEADSPRGVPSHPVVIVLGSSEDSALTRLLSPALIAAGCTVVTPTLCGFGSPSAFPTSYKGMAAAPDVARNLNRSIVGIHAADVVRVSRWAKQTFGVAVAVTVVTDELSSAVLHAAVLEPRSTGAIAHVGNVASYADIAAALLYSQGAEWAWIFNVLASYDLPDLVATAALAGSQESGSASNTRQLVLAPTDPVGKPLSADRLTEMYSFATEHLGSALSVVPGPLSPEATTAAVVAFVKNASQPVAKDGDRFDAGSML